MPKKSQQESDAELKASIDALIEGEEKKEEPTTPVEEKETSGDKPESEKEVIVADTDNPETMKDEGGETPSTKIKVGEVEYDPDELTSLVEKGKLAKKVEDEQKVDISQLYPEFTRRSQLLKNPEVLRQYVKDNFGFDMQAPTETLTEEEKALKEQIKRARDTGFLVKDDVPEIVANVLQAIELRDLKRTVESAAKENGLQPTELIDYMAYKNTKDAVTAAKELGYYKQVASGKMPTPPTPPKTEVPQKPEVLKTETKGTGVRTPPKERPIPHPDREPDAFAARILEFLEPKSPEEA